MKRGKDDEKTMEPMFPRLNVNDTEKGWPRAPPRNKMALYEQFTVPPKRSGPGPGPGALPLQTNISRTPVTAPSSSQGTETDGNLRLPLNLSSPTPSNQVGNSQALPSSEVNVNPPSVQLERSQQITEVEDEDDFMVPVFNQSKMSKNIVQNTDHREKLSSPGPKHSDCSTVLQAGYEEGQGYLTSSSAHSRREVTTRKTVSDKSRVNSAKSATNLLDRENIDGLQKETDVSKDEEFQDKSNLSFDKLRGSDIQLQRHSSIQPDDCGLVDDVVERTRFGEVDSVPCSRVDSHSLEKNENLNMPVDNVENHVDRTYSSMLVGNADKSDILSENSMIDSISGLDVCPDDVVGIIGPKHFWKARREIINTNVGGIEVDFLNDESLNALEKDLCNVHIVTSAGPTSETTDFLIIHCQLDPASCKYMTVSVGYCPVSFFCNHLQSFLPWHLGAEIRDGAYEGFQEPSLVDILTVQNFFRFSTIDFTGGSSVLFRSFPSSKEFTTLEDQQRVFEVQVFELHRLIKVQRLIAESPHLLLEGGIFLDNSSPSPIPTKKLRIDYTVKSPHVQLKHSDDPKEPKHNVECSAENAVGKTSLPPASIGCQPSTNGLYTVNPQPIPVSADNNLSSWYQTPAHHWLVPVMSPSEGLVYKPYPDPAIMYGGCGPYGPMPPMMNPFYGFPAPVHQGIGALPSTPMVGGTYFHPYGMPVMNPGMSGLSVDQVNRYMGDPNQLSGGVAASNLQHQTSYDVSTQRDRDENQETVSLTAKSQRNEVHVSTATSPAGKVQGNGVNRTAESRDMLSLFPLATPLAEEGPQPSDSDQMKRVIRVVPHNRRSANESAARIFQSIQNERKQYDSI